MTPIPIPAMSTEANDEAPDDNDADIGWRDSEIALTTEAQEQLLTDVTDNAAIEEIARGSGTCTVISDAQLCTWISAVAEHDEQALAALYDATMSRVFGIVLRIVRRHTLAQEVLEDTFFQVWRQAARFDPQRGRAITWLLSMARSRAIDCLRREARFEHDNLDEQDLHDLPDHRAAADELLDTARQHADLHRALTLLNAQPRQLVAMAFLEGLSHDEIANQTLLPLGTVKSQIRRALLTLREALGGRELSDLRNAMP